MSKPYNVSSAEFHNKPISVKCIITGKSLSPYCIPKVVEIISCSTKNKQVLCDECKYKQDALLEILPINESILKFIDVSDDRFDSIIKKIFHIPCEIICKMVEMQNIERIFILPPTSKDRQKIHLAAVAYYVGYGLAINTIYSMEGFTSVDPSNQTATHIFTKATKEKSDVESFEITESEHTLLTQEFCVKEPTAKAIYSYLYNLYEFYAHNITKIYNRFDLHLAVDLVFRSVITFNFDNEFVHKGWIDAIVIGDTRCGKGYVAEKLMRYYNLGEVVSGDICSFVGLVGGLQQFNKHWVVTWGKIPLNDGGLVVIDEASEIPTQDWTRLSRVRSEGVAEITKIQTQTTNARTRLLFLSNPINKTIANYSYGIQALSDVVKAPEDIARFDYALVVAHNEVSIDAINTHKENIAQIHNAELEQKLIMWLWSKSAENIQFSNEAITLVYAQAKELSKQYTFMVPLIQGENVRIKLAKLAIAFAGRVYSNHENGKILYVEAYHIECAVIFLNLIYKKESSGYYAMSQLQKDLTLSYDEKDFTSIDKYFSSFGNNRSELCKCLINNNCITAYDLAEHMSQPPEMAREIISKLLKSDCIIKRGMYYIKTPSFTNWLKHQILAQQKGV